MGICIGGRGGGGEGELQAGEGAAEEREEGGWGRMGRDISCIGMWGWRDYGW